MTVTLKTRQAVSATSGLSRVVNFSSDMAGDSRVLGMWNLTPDFATLASGEVSSFANYKSGSVALAATESRRSPLAFDIRQNETVMYEDGVSPANYQAPFTFGSPSAVSFIWSGRAIDFSVNYLARMNATQEMTVRTAANGMGAPQIRLQHGSDLTAVNLTGDPQRTIDVIGVFRSGTNIELQVSGEAPVAPVVTTNTFAGATWFGMGSDTLSLSHIGYHRFLGIANVDLLASANADLLAKVRSYLAQIK